MPDELGTGANARPDRGRPAPIRERYSDSAGGDANVPGRASGTADGAGAAQDELEGSGAASEHQEASLRPAGSERAGGDNGCDALLATATAKLQMTRSMSEGFLANLSKGTLHSQQGVLGSWCSFDVMGATIVTPRNDSQEFSSCSSDDHDGGPQSVGEPHLTNAGNGGGSSRPIGNNSASKASGVSKLGSTPNLGVYTQVRYRRQTQHAAPDIALPNARGPAGGLPVRFAMDIGGSLIKMVYFDFDKQISNAAGDPPGGWASSVPLMGGRLHFVKWETQQLPLAMSFVRSKNLMGPEQEQGRGDNEGNGNGDGDALEGRGGDVWSRPRAQTDAEAPTSSPHCGTQVHIDAAAGLEDDSRHVLNGRAHKKFVNATGGGAHKYAQMFEDDIGLHLHKCDEMDCLVQGANFLLQVVPDEAYTFLHNHKDFVPLANNGDLFPYLLVSIGSGVSIIKVDSVDRWERVSGTNLGGGTFVGLGRLLTGCTSFDELLELSRQGDNTKVDMLVGDIYGGDYSHIGLASTTIASSFGKVTARLHDDGMAAGGGGDAPSRADIALSLVRMISYNIGHIAYLNAMQYGLKRILFGGYFLRGNAYTMDTISFAIRFWSKGNMKAMFLRHEGFLGALGAFLKSAGVAPD